MQLHATSYLLCLVFDFSFEYIYKFSTDLIFLQGLCRIFYASITILNRRSTTYLIFSILYRLRYSKW